VPQQGLSGSSSLRLGILVLAVASPSSADRAEVCLSQLLLSADHPGGLLRRRRFAVVAGLFNRLARLLLSGDSGLGMGAGAVTGRDVAPGPVGRASSFLTGYVVGGLASNRARASPI